MFETICTLIVYAIIIAFGLWAIVAMLFAPYNDLQIQEIQEERENDKV